MYYAYLGIFSTLEYDIKNTHREKQPKIKLQR